MILVVQNNLNQKPMNEETPSQFETFEKKDIIRRTLLPIWVKIFCWIFMIGAVAGIICLIGGLLGYNPSLSMYGFETNEPITPIGFFIISIFLYKGFVAYSLWFEKDNAINLGKIDALTGIGLCIITMIVLPFFGDDFKITLRLEILLLILFYKKLNAIEYEWDNQEKQ